MELVKTFDTMYLDRDKKCTRHRSALTPLWQFDEGLVSDQRSKMSCSQEHCKQLAVALNCLPWNALT
jgi:hypothetical protein